jgi:hypothetical protein
MDYSTGRTAPVPRRITGSGASARPCLLGVGKLLVGGPGVPATRLLRKPGGEPDLSAYLMMYLTLEQCGWLPRFVTVELTGNPQVDYIIIAIHATQAAVGSISLSDNVSRGKRGKAAMGYWPHAIPPFGAQVRRTPRQGR